MKEYIKNPFNYQGGKYKILSQIEPYFPKHIDTFVDLFGGSGEVVLNDTVGVKHIYNEKCSEMCCLFSYMRKFPDLFIQDVEKIIKKYNLSKTNREGFNQLREDYNELVHKNPNSSYMKSIMFYALIAHSFNNQIGFNKKEEFNVPFGMNRSSFNNKMKNNLENYISKLQSMELKIFSMDFEDLFKNYSPKAYDFFYCDPPYLITVGGYERSYNLSWNEEKEICLLNQLDKLNEKNIKFALSNVLEHKGKTNAILTTWSKKYNIIDIKRDYTNCNYQTNKSENKQSKEVLITNY